jgi:hypothetical protein
LTAAMEREVMAAMVRRRVGVSSGVCGGRMDPIDRSKQHLVQHALCLSSMRPAATRVLPHCHTVCRFMFIRLLHLLRYLLLVHGRRPTADTTVPTHTHTHTTPRTPTRNPSDTHTRITPQARSRISPRPHTHTATRTAHSTHTHRDPHVHAPHSTDTDSHHTSDARTHAPEV